MPEWTLLLNNRIIKRFTIENGARITIGRSPDANVFIDNTAISRQHATLELKDGQYFITDHSSLNGTMVNDKKIEGTVQISAEDSIRIGKFLLVPTPQGEGKESTSFSYPFDTNDSTIFISKKESKKL
jgi:pSer/pThr/pTyr-binding forkhead associated (FHA) protein